MAMMAHRRIVRKAVARVCFWAFSQRVLITLMRSVCPAYIKVSFSSIGALKLGFSHQRGRRLRIAFKERLRCTGTTACVQDTIAVREARFQKDLNRLVSLSG